MFRNGKWSHGHSLGAGVLGGLLLSRRPELIFLAGLAVGVAAMYARRLTLALGHGAALLSRAKVRTELARSRELESRATQRKRTKAEQDAELERSYYAGARDGAAPTLAATHSRRRKGGRP
jgi:hypothetical protein